MTMRTLLLFTIGLILTACSTSGQAITNFEECIAAGNPAIESYPRQCRANGQTFVEVIDAPVAP